MEICNTKLFVFGFLVMIQPALVPHLRARDYFVSSQGDDSSTGTETQPWLSIEKVNTTELEPGDHILFRGGDTFHGNLVLHEPDSGVESKVTLISSYGSGRALIDAGNGTGLDARGCSYLDVKKIAFRGSGRTKGNNGSGIRLSGGSHISVQDVETSHFRLCGVSLNDVHHARITHVHAHDNGHAGIASRKPGPSTDLYVAHCLVENNPGDPENKDNHSGNGIVIGWAQDVLVEYCHARNNGWDMPREGNGPVGIWMFNTKNIVVQHCLSHDNRSPGDDGGGFDIDGGTENCIMQYNFSYNNDGPGYFLCQYPTAPPLKNNIIRYNISYNDSRKNNRKAGIDIFAAEPNAVGCEIYNNTVYNEYGAAVGFGGYHIPGVVFRNNIFVAGKVPLVGDYSAARFEGNLWWSLAPHQFSVDEFESFEQWSLATGQERKDGTLVGRYADPGIVLSENIQCDDPAALNRLVPFRLQPDSPCLGAGTVIPDNGGRDFWGNPVSNDHSPSLGAYEPTF